MSTEGKYWVKDDGSGYLSAAVVEGSRVYVMRIMKDVKVEFSSWSADERVMREIVRDFEHCSPRAFYRVWRQGKELAAWADKITEEEAAVV